MSCCRVNYRSGIGYGLNFREALNYGAPAAASSTMYRRGPVFKSAADVDPEADRRLGRFLWRLSHRHGALPRVRSVQAGVDFHGVHDWSAWRNYPAISEGDPKQRQARTEALRLAFDSSPMSSIDGWKSPVLLIHGDDDRNVSFSQTVMLAEALRKRHVEFEELIFPNEIHDFLKTCRLGKGVRSKRGFFRPKICLAPLSNYFRVEADKCNAPAAIYKRPADARSVSQ